MNDMLNMDTMDIYKLLAEGASERVKYKDSLKDINDLLNSLKDKRPDIVEKHKHYLIDEEFMDDAFYL